MTTMTVRPSRRPDRLRRTPRAPRARTEALHPDYSPSPTSGRRHRSYSLKGPSDRMRTPISAALRRLAAGTGVVVAALSFSTRAEAQEVRDEYHQAPRDTVTQEVYDGWKQYNLNCARCHGEDVLGTTIAPHLIMSLKPDGPINTKELFMQTVCAGRPEKGMPAWCALGLDMQKISDIYLYVKGRSDAKISPGRPAVNREG